MSSQWTKHVVGAQITLKRKLRKIVCLQRNMYTMTTNALDATINNNSQNYKRQNKYDV